MKHTYLAGAIVAPPRHFYRRVAGLLAAVLALSAAPATAQKLNYDVANAQNLVGSYTDLGTTGRIIPTNNFDNADSEPQSIGFNFSFNNTSFSTFILSSNGFIKLGSTALSDPFLYYVYAQTETVQGQIVFPGGPIASTDTRSTNIIAPFSTDLMEATSGGAEYRVATTGDAPNRVCTIQWKNVRDKPRQASSVVTSVVGTQYESFSFQVKLYEANGQIDFVYGPSTAGTGPDAFRTVAVGLKGTTPALGNVLMVDKNSANPWGSSIFIDNNYVGTDPHNIRSSVRPDVGRTYRFRPNAATDAVVQALYTVGQLPVGTPHTVRAHVRNAGTQPLLNLPVRLDVSGVNTFTNTQTISSLAPGSETTVSFATYTTGTRLGTNSVAVSVPADAYPGSDLRTESQVLTEGTFNYFPMQPSLSPTFSGFDTREGIVAARYTTPRATTVLAVTDFMHTASNSTGQPIQAVVTDAAGTILGITPAYTVRAADLGTTITLTFPAPVAIPAGDFMVGIAQQAGTVAHYPVGRLTSESPIRTGSFFDRVGIGSGNFNDLAPRGFGPMMIGAITTNTVTGTAKAATGVAFALVPNPTQDIAHLTLAAALPVAQTISVLDALGRPVRQQVLPARTTQAQLQLSDLPRGVYTVRVSTTAQRLVLE